MFNTEKQSTTRASKISIEETFMNCDTSDTNFDPSIGYRFPYPQNWLSNPSQQKMIGLRSLEITPSSHMILMNISVYTMADTLIPPSDNLFAVPLNLIITHTSDLELIFKYISEQFVDAFYTPVTVGNTTYLPRFSYGYDAATGKIQMIVRDMLDQDLLLKFKFDETDTATEVNFKEFAKFLNQPDYTSFKPIIETSNTLKTFNDVWDRQTLYFHSTFSTTRRGLIGRNNAFWPSPSKKYFFRDATNDFYISFTTDGSHKIFPYYCKFYLELTLY